MSLEQAIKSGFNRYTDFRGRSSRSAYWWWTLFVFILSMAASVIDLSGDIYPLATIIVALALFIPGLAVTVRRLHDASHSGWWILINFVPIIGFFVMLFFTLQPSHGPNQWGQGPDGQEGQEVAA